MFNESRVFNMDGPGFERGESMGKLPEKSKVERQKASPWLPEAGSRVRG